MYETDKHGWVLEIEERQGNVQNLPMKQCRRMYGNTRATTADTNVAKKKAATQAVRRKAL
jgi:hypothetical protein